MSGPSRDPSIAHEPQFALPEFAADATEQAASEVLNREQRAAQPDAEHTVWDEPALAAELAGQAPADQVTYARWLQQRVAATSYGRSLATTALLAAAAGPLGVLGALFGGEGGGLSTAGLVAITIFGPVTEEVMKVAGTLWVVEKKPWLFKSIWQILVAAAAGGLFFGVIENWIYLHLYIPDATPALVRWRWRVCTGLHLNCSFIAGIGLARIWEQAMRRRTPPHVGVGLPWLVIAMAGHGLYNLAVTVADLAGWLDLG